MAVAHKLAAEFPGRFLAVLRTVAHCSEGDMNSDASQVESAAREQLSASTYGEQG